MPALRVVYMGTPRFAVPTLEAIVNAGHEVLAVLTQPDRPKGRGQALMAPPVKECALKLGLRIEQPERVRRPEPVEMLRALNADIMVVVGYGQIIPQSILDLPPLGIVNVHASLLPKYRGAGPIQWAIANGETITGVTTMRIDAGLDTGDILLMRDTPIGPEEDANQLGERLSTMGAELLVETLAGLQQGIITPIPQDNAQATYAPLLKKEDGRIDWQQPATVIHNRARGFLPWPGCYSRFRGQGFHIWRCRPADSKSPLAPGQIRGESGRLLAGCGGESALELLEVQVEGRKRIEGSSFLNGQRLLEYEVLGD